jgi:hypothetical protein
MARARELGYCTCIGGPSGWRDIVDHSPVKVVLPPLAKRAAFESHPLCGTWDHNHDEIRPYELLVTGADRMTPMWNGQFRRRSSFLDDSSGTMKHPKLTSRFD